MTASTRALTTDSQELFDAVKNLAGIYFKRVPAADMDQEQLADCITEGLGDEFSRLCDIERTHNALAEEAERGGFVDLTDALAHASDGQVGKFGGAS
jgi:hypothetical protein